VEGNAAVKLFDSPVYQLSLCLNSRSYRQGLPVSRAHECDLSLAIHGFRITASYYLNPVSWRGVSCLWFFIASSSLGGLKKALTFSFLLIADHTYQLNPRNNQTV
jgi:hypothetical protein